MIECNVINSPALPPYQVASRGVQKSWLRGGGGARPAVVPDIQWISNCEWVSNKTSIDRSQWVDLWETSNQGLSLEFTPGSRSTEGRLFFNSQNGMSSG